ncbi:MAG: DNA-dependent ATPase I and helicase II, DNA helicase II / ATP-dependent DNA helicase PcrA [Candidatus Peregrinibacteria bacterium GW2011_GWF2_33_10]|nr:MAG: DNA-dependent ATPase I and helicase II, DNA helicase II / ATP-dependent DNA helicase PcrA [Candidatus Peregrinibacteria bacterium GW2011_GWF2_33_10]OGJ44133.1 MAG: hypothetical protein A2263_01790 [Candidatus Peregrinibacteria bacterium RIFOXYA2_FULL_33_21]OGJ47472.1 MAG: hypothetical protein A2272_06045 [Candidatus Peregrinibacteria bacterium RIFOXYA12_FULL_33_12]OGJ49971.1 MAG: hypothetical protein A2307_03770 [Candidatus Peregrinibacteria bacterium RIFOXYB2_FULL_33_20]
MSDQNFQIAYQNLNPAQKQAVNLIEGSVMVIAGPGTGKTQVLALRIANILEKTHVNPSNILALTFTESGAMAMKKRLAEIIGHSAYFVPIYTFHAFCNQIIKEYPEKFIELRYSSSEENGEWNFNEMEAISQLEKFEILEKIIDKLALEQLRPIKAPYFYIQTILKSIQSIKREGINAESFEQILMEERKALELEPKFNEKTGKELLFYKQKEKNLNKNFELLEIFKSYQNELGKRSKFDFDDMILFVIKKLETDSELLLMLQERFQYILVDEYQDTNNSQNKFVTLLMNYFENPNLFVVGDDDQSIYRFQGANMENFLYINDLYKNIKFVVLKENYRSSTNILETAKSLISNNEKRVTNVLGNIDKNFEAKGKFKNEKIKTQIIKANNENSEKFFIIDEIKNLQKTGVNLSDIAVLCRTNKDVSQIEEIFERSNIPYQIEGGIDVLKDKEIQKFLKLFDLIGNINEDNFLFFEVMQFDFLNLPIKNVFEVIGTDLSILKNLLKLIQEEEKTEKPNLFGLEFGNEISSKKKDEFVEIKIFLRKLLKWHKDSVNLTLSEFFELVLKESGFLDFVLAQSKHVELLIKVNSLFEYVKNINRKNKNLSLNEFMKSFDVMDKYNITISEKTFYHKLDAVKLMTAHKSKGLEFEYLFVYKCVDQVWGNNFSRELIKLPSFSSQLTAHSSQPSALSSNNELEDERRLFYVAITRAKKSLYLSYAQKYLQNGTEKEVIPSIFVTEIEKICEFKDISEIENSVEERLKANLKDKDLDIHKSKIEDFALDKLENFTLSVTALNAYLYCPRKFFYNNILRLPRAKPSYMAFGTAIHKALEIFFRKFQEENKIPELNIMIETFENAIKKETVTSDDKERWLKKGKDVLTLYFENYKNEFKVPIFLEKFLRTYLEDIPISGKLDKIEYIDADKKTIKVIDYKTGKFHTRNDIEGKTESSTGDLKRQMLFYKILTDATPGFLFNTQICEFDFIEAKDNKFRKEAFELDLKDIEDLKIIIKETMQKIRALKFDKTSDLSKCGTCEFRKICGR